MTIKKKIPLIDDRMRLELALDIAQICLIEFARDDDKVEVVSLENARSIFGCSTTVTLRMLQQLDSSSFDNYVEAFAMKFVHPEDRYLMKELGNHFLNSDIYTSELRILQANGQYSWCKFTASPIVINGRIDACVIVLMNINNEKEKMLKLELSNMMDSFTDIYNKSSSLELINKAIENSGDNNKCAFAILDINEFKSFNDTYGHDVGDEILKIVAKTLRLEARKNNCIVGRFGGDEFIILVKKFENKEHLYRIFSNMTHYEVDNHPCTTSIGVSILNDDARTFSRLFKHADLALYEAKKNKEPIVFYSDIATKEQH